jgi:hypothetical protein
MNFQGLIVNKVARVENILMKVMKQCLRCGGVCTGTSIFCQSCQSSLLNCFEQKSFQTEPMACPETKMLPETKMIQDGDSVDSGPLAVRPLPWVRRRAALRRMRRILIVLGLLIVIVLIIDAILVLLVFTHSPPIMRY